MPSKTINTPNGQITVEVRERPAHLDIDNTELVTAFLATGGRLFHVPPSETCKRGFTVAYKERSGRVTFSTAVQHTNDVFVKKIGTKTAIEHFNEGKTVTLPFGKHTKNAFAMLSDIVW